MRSRTWRPRRVLALLLAPLIALMTLSLVPVAPASGVAGDIVVNGGFEVVSGTTYAPIYANWSYSGGIRTGGGYFASTYDIHTGSHAFFVMNPADVVLTQVLTTSPGTTYDLGFWHSSVIGTSLTAAVIQGATTTSLGSFAGTGYYGPVNPPYVEHTGLSFTATGTAVTLRFVLNDPGGYAGWLVALDDVSVVPQTAATVPAAPAALTAVGGNGQVELSWSAPDDGGAAILDYQIGYAETGTGPMDYATSTTTSTTIAGLTNGTTYEFVVRARNDVGTGPWSQLETATPAATVPAAPAAPTTDVVSAGQPAGVGRVDLSWSAPDDGGEAITGYTVAYKVSGQTTWQTRTTTTTSVSLSALTAGLPYEFKVLATNGVGAGPYSAVSTATPVTVPMALWVAPTAVAGDGQVDLSWTAADDCGAEIIDYTIGYIAAGSTMVTTTSTTTSATITGLTNGTTYQFVVRARNSVGTGDWSAAATATPVASATAPAAPAAPTAVAGNGQVELSWSAPDDGGSAITGYWVVWKAASDQAPNWTACATTSKTITGLTNGVTYEFKVAAENQVGIGGTSATTTATPVAPATAPGAPTDLVAVAGNAQVELSWSAPVDDGGADITGYTVSYKAVSDSTWTGVSASGTSKTVTGLTNGTAYEFKVLATNSVGDGPYSSMVTATPVTPTLDVLDAIAHLRSDVVALDLGKAETRLTALLYNAVKDLQQANESEAVVKLESFIDKVEAMTSGGKKAKDLTSSEADHLIQHAEMIILALTS